MLKVWLICNAVALVVAFGSFLIRPRDIPWATHLERPRWLFFEPAIPLIWTTIFVAGATSAALVWQQEPQSLRTWLLMGCYLLVEAVTVAYIPATLRLHSLTVGTILGATGLILGLGLTLLVWPISGWAALLLLPYLLWSPVGTYTTKRMIRLNPDVA